nr:unnamed protein product [Spirometra erinaceieuropaei]
MGNSSTVPESQLPFSAERRLSDKILQKSDNFEQRWQVFVASLDVCDEKVHVINQLPHQRKLELLLNFELKDAKFLPSTCVENIKGAKISHIANSRRKQDHEEFRRIFASSEISLRTNKIE